MLEIVNLILHWLHLIASVIWLGGIIFFLYVLNPKAKEILKQDAGKLTGEISKRFKKFADWSIIALIITGIGISLLDKYSLDNKNSGHYYLLTTIIKHVFVLIMVIIHLYRNYILSGKIANEPNPTNKTTLQKLSLNLVKVVLLLGLIVLLFSAAQTT